MTGVIAEIEAERRRQIALGHDAAHDDAHHSGEIVSSCKWGATKYLEKAIGVWWPRSENREYRQALLIAAALIVAEIERLDRRATRRTENGCGNG
jgi:hypothetical protein